MYEVFNWGYLNDEPPKRLNLSFAATEINIDGPTKYTNIRNNTKGEGNLKKKKTINTKLTCIHTHINLHKILIH